MRQGSQFMELSKIGITLNRIPTHYPNTNPNLNPNLYHKIAGCVGYFKVLPKNQNQL